MIRKYFFNYIMVATLSIMPVTGKSQAVCVKKPSYHGFLFPDSYDLNKFYPFGMTRYTPVESDIELAEKIIRIRLPALESQMPPLKEGCPSVSKKLKKYIRQYFGVQSNQGDKIIFINAFWPNREYNARANKEIIIILDGCSFYWQLKVNLTKGTIYEFSINGDA